MVCHRLRLYRLAEFVIQLKSKPHFKSFVLIGFRGGNYESNIHIFETDKFYEIDVTSLECRIYRMGNYKNFSPCPLQVIFEWREFVFSQHTSLVPLNVTK